MTNLLTLQGIEGAAILGRARERVISDELHTMLVTWLEAQFKILRGSTTGMSLNLLSVLVCRDSFQQCALISALETRFGCTSSRRRAWQNIDNM